MARYRSTKKLKTCSTLRSSLTEVRYRRILISRARDSTSSLRGKYYVSKSVLCLFSLVDSTLIVGYTWMFKGIATWRHTWLFFFTVSFPFLSQKSSSSLIPRLQDKGISVNFSLALIVSCPSITGHFSNRYCFLSSLSISLPVLSYFSVHWLFSSELSKDKDSLFSRHSLMYPYSQSFTYIDRTGLLLYHWWQVSNISNTCRTNECGRLYQTAGRPRVKLRRSSHPPTCVTGSVSTHSFTQVTFRRVAM